MPLSSRDLERLQGCHPDFIAKLKQLLGLMEAAGHPLFVVEGFRSTARQQALFAQGRTQPGKIVTQCDGVQKKSNHQAHADGLGYAADVAFIDKDPFAASHPWATLGSEAEGLGLKWGGHFSILDLDHIEMPAPPVKGA